MFYSCNSISDFLENDNQKKEFYSFLLTNTCNANKRVVIILGGSGYGKTTFCENIFRDIECSKHFSFIRPIYEHVQTHKEFSHFIETSINTFNILNFNQRNKLLFLDDVDILFTINRQASKYILDLVKNLKNTPHLRIVMTCSISEEKKVSDMKKKGAQIIRLDKPSLNVCTIAISEYIKQVRQMHIHNHIHKHKHKETPQIFRENITAHEHERIKSLTKVLDCNIRSILAHIEEVITLYPIIEQKNENNKENKKNDIIESYSHHMTNNFYTNMNVLDIAENIMCHSHRGLLDLVIPLSSDPNLLSMILYENLVPFLMKNYCFQELILLDLKKIYDAFTVGSIFETDVYKNASWEIVNLDWMHLYKCGIIRLLQNNISPSLSSHDSLSSRYKLKYTSILVRSTQHYFNTNRWLKWGSQHDLNHVNIMFLCEVSEELRSYYKKTDEKNEYKEKEHFESVSDEGFMHATYVKNMKDKKLLNKLYDKKLIRKNIVVL